MYFHRIKKSNLSVKLSLWETKKNSGMNTKSFPIRNSSNGENQNCIKWIYESILYIAFFTLCGHLQWQILQWGSITTAHYQNILSLLLLNHLALINNDQLTSTFTLILSLTLFSCHPTLLFLITYITEPLILVHTSGNIIWLWDWRLIAAQKQGGCVSRRCWVGCSNRQQHTQHFQLSHQQTDNQHYLSNHYHILILFKCHNY